MRHLFFTCQAWKLYERGMQLDLVDKRIELNEYDAEEVKKIIEIALLCTQASAAKEHTTFYFVLNQKWEMTFRLAYFVIKIIYNKKY